MAKPLTHWLNKQRAEEAKQQAQLAAVAPQQQGQAGVAAGDKSGAQPQSAAQLPPVKS